MLGQFKPVAYEPYGRRRSGVPRWLVLLIVGALFGAAAVIAVQELYLPARLTVDASQRMRTAFERAEADHKRAESDLADVTKRFEALQAQSSAALADVAAARAAAQRLRDDLTSVIVSLPPDPRPGSVEVRAARFSVKKGQLVYDVVLTRERGGAQPLQAALQILVTGQNARGVEATVALAALPIAIGSHEVPRGSVALPDAFKPRQATLQVLDRGNGKLLGARVFLVN